MSLPQDASAARTGAGETVPRPTLTGVPVGGSRSLSEREFEVFGAVGQRTRIAAGEVLFQRGQSGRQMYVIVSGQVRLDFGDGITQRVLGPHESFGELALFMGHHARMASATVESHAELLVIDPPAFERLFEREPATMAQFMRRCFAYLIASETQLIQGLRRRNEDLMQTLESLRQTRSELSLAQQLVSTDELTGLSNRRGLYRFLEQLGEPPPGEPSRALLLVDIDEFKRVNDLSGHLAGDSALRAVAEEVRAACGPLELPCRLGGDEFAMVALSADAGDLANRAVQLVAAVRSLRLGHAGTDIRLGVSVGACFFRPGEPWSATYSRADAALYQAKLAGGDTWKLGR